MVAQFIDLSLVSDGKKLSSAFDNPKSNPITCIETTKTEREGIKSIPMHQIVDPYFHVQPSQPNFPPTTA